MIKIGIVNRNPMNEEDFSLERDRLERAYESQDLTEIVEGTVSNYDYMNMRVTIGRKQHMVHLAKALVFETRLEDLTDEAIDRSLEFVSVDRTALVLASEEAKLMLRKRKRELTVWTGQLKSTVRKRVVQAKVQEQEELGRDKATSDAFRVTEAELIQGFSIDADYGEEYNRRMEQLEELETLADKFSRIEKVVSERGYHVMNIANRRAAMRQRLEVRDRNGQTN